MSPPVLLGPLDAHRAAGGNTARVWGSSRTSLSPYIVLCKRPQNARSHGHPWSRTSVLGWFPGPHGSNRWARAPGLNQRCGSFPGSRPARAILVGGGALHRANHQRGGDCPGLILYPGGTGWLFETPSLALRRTVPRPQPLNPLGPPIWGGSAGRSSAHVEIESAPLLRNMRGMSPKRTHNQCPAVSGSFENQLVAGRVGGPTWGMGHGMHSTTAPTIHMKMHRHAE